MDPRDQLLVVERPRDEVVAAALERVHTVDRIRSRLAEDDHRDIAVPAAAWLALAQSPADVEAGGILEPAGEHEVRAHALGKVESQLLRRSAEDLEAVARQVTLEELPRSRLGLGEEQRARHAADASAAERTAPDVLFQAIAPNDPKCETI